MPRLQRGGANATDLQVEQWARRRTLGDLKGLERWITGVEARLAASGHLSDQESFELSLDVALLRKTLQEIEQALRGRWSSEPRQSRKK